MNYPMIWEIAIGAAGIGATGAFIFFSLYKKWLSLPIFASLTRQQTFLLMRLFLIFAFVFAIFALLIYAYTESFLSSEDSAQSNTIISGENSTNLILKDNSSVIID